MIVAFPLASAAGVNVRSPFDATAGAVENSAALVLFVTTKVSVCADSLAGPALIAVAQPVWLNAPLFSSTVTSAPLVKPGASLTDVTVMTNVCVGDASTPPFAVPPLSISRSVIVAVPLAFAAGV